MFFILFWELPKAWTLAYSSCYVTFSSEQSYPQLYIYTLVFIHFLLQRHLKMNKCKKLIFPISPIKLYVSPVFYSSLINHTTTYPITHVRNPRVVLDFSLHFCPKLHFNKIIIKFCLFYFPICMVPFTLASSTSLYYLVNVFITFCLDRLDTFWF